jgi:3-ketosteroid 9alpha-monooxygenase subunit A
VRRWYEQFYCDVADIAPDMVARYEFEIDTTRAVAGWEAEVAANLTRATSRGGLGGSSPRANTADAG